MLTLLVKDFKMMFSKEKSLSKRIVSAIFSLVFVACFVALETFLFYAVLDKIKDYKQAPIAFMTLFLFVITLLLVFSGVFQAMKLFFNPKDIEQLTNYPVTNQQIVTSKLIFLFLSHYATAFMFVYPLFVAYGIAFSKPIIFYYTALFYPAVTFFFDMGVALIFVYPVRLALQYLKRHVIAEFVIAVALLFAVSFVYSQILNVFIELVANNRLTSLFTTENIQAFVSFEKFLVPVNFLTDVFIENNDAALLPYLGICLGVFAIGTAITVAAFHHVRNMSVSHVASNKERKFKQRSAVNALVNKEVTMLTKDSDYIFSYTGLLIVQPFLLYLIITALNTIFSSGAFMYYASLVPNFVTLVDMLVIMMFTLVINQGANRFISMEQKNVRNMKTIPVSYRTQLLIKVSIPFLLSFASLFVSLIVLWASGAMPFGTVAFSLIIATLLLFVFEIISLTEELKIRHNKPRTTYVSTLYAYLLPLLYVAVGIVLSYLGVSVYLVYASGIALFILLGLPQVLYLYKRMGDLFLDLEVFN